MKPSVSAASRCDGRWLIVTARHNELTYLTGLREHVGFVTTAAEPQSASYQDFTAPATKKILPVLAELLSTNTPKVFPDKDRHPTQ